MSSRILSDEDIDAIAQRLTEFSGLTPEDHKKHHDAISLWIDRQNKRNDRWEKVQAQVGGWAVIAILSSIGYAVWNSLLLLVGKGH